MKKPKLFKFLDWVLGQFRTLITCNFVVAISQALIFVSYYILGEAQHLAYSKFELPLRPR